MFHQVFLQNLLLMQLPVILIKTEAGPHTQPSCQIILKKCTKLAGIYKQKSKIVFILLFFFNVICYKKMQKNTLLPKIKLLPLFEKL